MKHQVRQLKWVAWLVAALALSFYFQPTSLIPTAAAQGGSGSPRPKVSVMRGKGKVFDLRSLPYVAPVKGEQPEPRAPINQGIRGGVPGGEKAPNLPVVPSAPAPAPDITFDGLDFATWGAGHPPDTNGDVGPTYYIQTVNTAIGVYNKTGGAPVAAFTFNTFMSQGAFGNLCDTNNFGDPVVLYDSFEDRWIITDFAFTLNGSGQVINPPGNFQCIAVSKTGDPVSGGWNFYSINTEGGLGDYPKFGIWPDGLYMSVNMFSYSLGFQVARAYAFNKTQMYAGDPTVQVITFDAPAAEFALMPSNARLQTGTPPTGTPNHFAVIWQFLNAVNVYDFHVDWNNVFASTFTGPGQSLMPFWWARYLNSCPSGTLTSVPSPVNRLDSLYPRLMMQNQYTNIGAVESLWLSHTVGAGNPTSNVCSTQTAVRYYQVKVTGGTVEANATQSFTYSPDATIFRFMPSLALNRVGDMAMGYSTSNLTTNPAIKYAGRLAGDPANSITQDEQLLWQGTGTQSGTCGSTCIRWGDYSAMTLDPDGCTFWFTTEYYAVTGLNDLTRIGSFKYPSCTPLANNGTVQGTVTSSATSTPISGATVALGTRTTTTDGSGFYQFTNLPAGTYPTEAASCAGFTSASTNLVPVADSTTTTRNFALDSASTGGCLTDTSTAQFQMGVPTNLDLTGSPGNVTLLDSNTIEQNTSVTNSGFGFNSTSWAGQTFTPAVSGPVARIDLNLFCSGCTGTTPNLTVSLRATTGSPAVPTGGDLATATIPGFSSGAGGYFTANFASPTTVTAGTRYAIVLRAVTNPSAGIYAYVCSCSPDSNPYANGQRVTSANSGSTWVADTTSGGRDLGFKVYIHTGYPSTGTLVSSLKDANPAAGFVPKWTTISWNANVPSGTTVKFQAAASNSSTGPFNFVGPGNTNTTYFNSGDALTQFNSKRYLKYKVFFTSDDSTLTPTLSDVAVCYTTTTTTDAELASFAARLTQQHRVLAAWTTAREAKLQGFNLWRATKKDGKYTKLNKEMIPAKSPGTSQGNLYRRNDRTVKKGKVYFYKLELIHADGKSTWSDIVRMNVK